MTENTEFPFGANVNAVVSAVEAGEPLPVFDDQVLGSPSMADNEIINIDDMEDVPDDDRVVLPAARNVKMKIVEIKKQDMSGGKLKKLNIKFQLTDGILVDGEMKFAGATFWHSGGFFDNIFYYADPAEYSKDYWKQKKHLMNLKKLMKVCGVQTFNPNNLDQFKNIEFQASIIQVEDTVKEEATGAFVPTGTFSNAAKYYAPITVSEPLSL